MPQDTEKLYADLPEPRHVWVTSRESHPGDKGAVTEADWDAFVAGHPAGHLLQTSRWAVLKCAFGWQADRAILRTIPNPDAPILGGASLLFRRLPWGQTLAYVPRGPVVDWAAADQVRAVLTLAREIARKRRAALLKIEPEHSADPALTTVLQDLDFRPSPQRIQPLCTIQVELADDATMLARMRPKWRYNIRLAERKGVTVRTGTMADLPKIQHLLTVTGQRDRFGVHSPAYYARATELFMTDGSAVWLVAEHEGRMLAAIAVFALSRLAWYMWGASADEDRNLMPNHALQWAAMRWARARGCAIYDLWGIPDEVCANPHAYTEPESWGEGGLWGVYRFKQGFGGRVVRYAGAWDLPLSQAGYGLYRLGLRVRQGLLSARNAPGL
ncbi:MAG: lipid II:glycine glycyltransferase FemX [Anaerolineae bacterium]